MSELFHKDQKCFKFLNPSDVGYQWYDGRLPEASERHVCDFNLNDMFMTSIPGWIVVQHRMVSLLLDPGHCCVCYSGEPLS